MARDLFSGGKSTVSAVSSAMVNQPPPMETPLLLLDLVSFLYF
jgi:hypothetical protein